MSECEPLRGKIRYKDINWSAKPYDNYIQANLKVEDVKSAVGFYKRYKNNIEKLQSEQFKIYKKYKREHYLRKYESKYEEIYNAWLFDYCFGDVIDAS